MTSIDLKPPQDHGWDVPHTTHEQALETRRWRQSNYETFASFPTIPVDERVDASTPTNLRAFESQNRSKQYDSLIDLVNNGGKPLPSAYTPVAEQTRANVREAIASMLRLIDDTTHGVQDNVYNKSLSTWRQHTRVVLERRAQALAAAEESAATDKHWQTRAEKFATNRHLGRAWHVGLTATELTQEELAALPEDARKRIGVPSDKMAFALYSAQLKSDSDMPRWYRTGELRDD